MKLQALLIAASFTWCHSQAQDIRVTPKGNAQQKLDFALSNEQVIDHTALFGEFKLDADNAAVGYSIREVGAPNDLIAFATGSLTYNVLGADANLKPAGPALNERKFEVRNAAGMVVKTFSFQMEDPDKKRGTPPPSIATELQRWKSSLRSTNYGVQVQNSALTSYSGRKFVHLFFDQHGNALMAVPPQGISNLQYVVHVFYLQDRNSSTPDVFSVVQTAGEFQDALVFQNYDMPTPQSFVPTSGKKQELVIAHSEFLLRTSTTNIQFNITRTNTDGTSATTSVVAGHSIPMAKVYHGSIDIGFINSRLSNPSFSLVSSAMGDTTVVKREESGNRGFVSLMATFYASPVMLLKRRGSVPDFKRYGRSFLDDHAWYERIFPCVGVGISDQAFENLFLGLNWEFARGGSLWLGYHYGKVNVYEEPEGFIYGETPTSQDEFNLRTDSQWRWSKLEEPSFGVNLDLRLVTRLFGGGVTSTEP